MRWKEDDNWLIWFDLLTELFWMHTGHWEEHSAVLSDHHTYDSAQVRRSTLHWQELTHNGKRKAWQLESSFDLICWQSFWMHRTLSSTLSSSLSSAQWSHLSLITQHRYEGQHWQELTHNGKRKAWQLESSCLKTIRNAQIFLETLFQKLWSTVWTN